MRRFVTIVSLLFEVGGVLKFTYSQGFDAKYLLTNFIPNQLSRTMQTTGKYNSYPLYANYSQAVGEYVYFGSAYNGWTSGFFPGELWAMYEFSGDKYAFSY